jgi:hypothetical protein
MVSAASSPVTLWLPQLALHKRNEYVVSRPLKGSPARSYPLKRSIAFNQGAPASRQDGAQLVFSGSSLLDHSHIIRFCTGWSA